MPIPGLPFSDAQIFTWQNGVLPAWALLAVAPRWRYTKPIVTLTACFFALIYSVVLLPQLFGGSGQAPDLFTYEGVVALLGTRDAVLGAWMHYVVLDLWAGRWEVEDAAKRGVPQAVMAVALFLTMMLAPFGLLAYLAAVRPFFPERRAATKAD